MSFNPPIDRDGPMTRTRARSARTSATAPESTLEISCPPNRDFPPTGTSVVRGPGGLVSAHREVLVFV